jgi:hypothetical protein
LVKGISTSKIIKRIKKLWIFQILNQPYSKQ